MAHPLTFARTKPNPSLSARQWLKDRAETLTTRFRRVKPLHQTFSWQRKGMYDIYDMNLHYRNCPLPPTRLIDGTRPYRIPEEKEDALYGGKILIEDLADSRIPVLWRECLASKPAFSGLLIHLKPPEWFDSLRLHLKLTANQSGTSLEFYLDWAPRDSDADGLAKFLSAMGLDKEPQSIKTLATPHIDMVSECRVYRLGRLMITGVSPDPDLSAQLTDKLVRLGWLGPMPLESSWFDVNDREEAYTRLRPRLNSITRDWDSDFYAFYTPGFDPFLTPPAPAEGESYRFPVASYYKPNADTDELTIQLDIVHSCEGTFLEFCTAESLKTLRRYAELSDLEYDQLELWKGAAVDRWRI